jgi:hypothetical protein
VVFVQLFTVGFAPETPNAGRASFAAYVNRFLGEFYRFCATAALIDWMSGVSCTVCQHFSSKQAKSFSIYGASIERGSNCALANLLNNANIEGYQRGLCKIRYDSSRFSSNNFICKTARVQTIRKSLPSEIRIAI